MKPMTDHAKRAAEEIVDYERCHYGPIPPGVAVPTEAAELEHHTATILAAIDAATAAKDKRIAELQVERANLQEGLRDAGRGRAMLTAERDAALAEAERLRLRLLTATGDDLCRLTQEEIKELSSGKVQIPPKAEFLASCERFHAQIAGDAGELSGCLTLAQLIAENERLRNELEATNG